MSIRVLQLLLNLIDLAMAGGPSSPGEARLAALLVMAETVVAKTDEETGNWDWKGRSEAVEVIALLASVIRTANTIQVSNISPSSSRQERSGIELEISPTIPWMAEEERRTEELTIVERGQLFSAWSEKRRRLREG